MTRSPGGQEAEMDHAYIDEQQVVERYLLGRLPPAEAARFEEHSLACAECLDRLEAAETLRLGLRAVAARDAAAEVVKLSLLARIVRSRLAPAGFLLLLLAALLPAGLLWRRAGRLEGELASAREARRPPAPAGAMAPWVNVPLVFLSPERSGPGGAPSTRVALPPSAGWVVLSLELAAVEQPRYRATLLGPDRRTLWQGSDLRPDAQGSLTIAFPAARLRSGDFTVRVEGLPARGGPVAVADYAFRLVPAP